MSKKGKRKILIMNTSVIVDNACSRISTTYKQGPKVKTIIFTYQKGKTAKDSRPYRKEPESSGKNRIVQENHSRILSH